MLRLTQDPCADPLADVASAAATGDPRAVERLVTEIGPSVLRIVRQTLGPHHPDVKDVAQDSLIELLKSVHGFRGECTFRHFACRVALMRALNASRRLRLQPQITPDGMDPGMNVTTGRTPLHDAIANSRLSALRYLLRELPPGQACVLALHCILQYTIAEIAEELGIPVNTVRGRLVSAKRALRERLGADPELYDLMCGAE